MNASVCTEAELLARQCAPASSTPPSVYSCFRSAALRWPDRAAIIDGGSTVNYRQLLATATGIACALATRLGSAPEPVALLLESGPQMLAAMLGTMELKFYVPLDPLNPAARLTTMLEDSTARVMLTDAAHLDLAHQLVSSRASADTPVMILTLEQMPAIPDDSPTLASSHPESPTWLLYTSGSTGMPKGVFQTNRNVLQYVDNYTRGLQVTPDDRYALLFSCSVNAGSHVALTTLLNGATLCMYDVRRRGLAALPAWLEEQRITLYASVPTLFRNWARDMDSGRRFPVLRYLMLIGEPVYSRDLELYRTLPAPNCTLINRLGSTETGSILWSFCRRNEQPDGPLVPVGRPVAGNEILLLDESGQPVAAGESAEIVVRSRYLSPGYWRRPDLTARAFETDPLDPDLRLFHTGDLGRALPDGSYVCLGRRDSQIKVRGYRVEPAEIELALLQCPLVREAMVVGNYDSEGQTRLIAYFVPAKGCSPTVGDLRRWLVTRLPEHMVPSLFVPLTAWPLAPNGKIDRKALPPPDARRPHLDATFVAPRTATERDLVELWQRALNVEPIGVDDSFVDLGGTSILAMRILAWMTTKYATRIPLRRFFEVGTVAALASLVDHRPLPGSDPQSGDHR